jgi:hypothetical protein
MEDIISQGDDRPPGSPRRKWLIAAAVVAVAALVLVEHVPHGGTKPHQVSSRNLRHGGGEATIKLGAEVPTGPSGIPGVHLKVTAATRLPRTGAQPAWYWPGNGSAQRIGGLSYDWFGYVFTRVGGGWAIHRVPVGPTGCGNCPGPPVTVYYLANSSRQASKVGLGTMVAPGARTGTLWLTTFPARLSLGARPGVAREFSGTGRPLGPRVELPSGYTIGQGTSRGLLLVSNTQRTSAAADVLWNPAARHLTRSFNGVIAVSANQVAVTPPCAATCPVQVISLVTGRTVLLSVPPGSTVTDGDFSPDDRFLALQVSIGDTGDEGAFAIQLDVADLTTGQVLAVPGTRVNSDMLDGFGWPGEGDNLAVELTFATKVQMAIWSPVKASLAVADVDPDKFPASLVIG